MLIHLSIFGSIIMANNFQDKLLSHSPLFGFDSIYLIRLCPQITQDLIKITFQWFKMVGSSSHVYD